MCMQYWYNWVRNTDRMAQALELFCNEKEEENEHINNDNNNNNNSQQNCKRLNCYLKYNGIKTMWWRYMDLMLAMPNYIAYTTNYNLCKYHYLQLESNT